MQEAVIAPVGHSGADAPPRLTASKNKPHMYNGNPRIAIDGSTRGTEVSTAVYAERGRTEAQVTLMLGGTWSVSIYSNPEQLREFAALLNDTADLVEVVSHRDRDDEYDDLGGFPDDDPDDGPYILPDSAERLQDCTTNGIGAPQ